MTDMPAFYPRELIDSVNVRLADGQPVHSLVLWTKHPLSLLRDPLYNALEEWKRRGIQLSVQLTVTGFGGIRFKNNKGSWVKIETGVPTAGESLKFIPEVIRLVGDPRLVAIRFDPVMKVSSGFQAATSNLSFLPGLLHSMELNGLERLIYSFLVPGIYKKVDRHFDDAGLVIEAFTEEEKRAVRRQIENLCSRSGIRADACCVEGFAATACIDGVALAGIKQTAESVDTGSLHRRPLCSCTKTTDLGGWPPKPCYSGCLYCYARPVVRPQPETTI